jgi:hypothetical protein
MENRRFTFMDRRRNSDVPGFPVEGNDGVAIKTDRRKIRFRRRDDIWRLDGLFVDWIGIYSK